MAFRFQRRLNFGSGIGLNLSKSGVSPSMRTKFGTIGAKGFSIRTGIPGLTFRQSWGKSGAGAVIGLIAMLIIAAINMTVFFVTLGVSLLVLVLKLLWVLIAIIYNLGMWSGLTIYDFIQHLREARQESASHEAESTSRDFADDIET